MLKILTILFSFFIVIPDDLQTGIDYYNARAQNAKGLQAEAANIDNAIRIFEELLSKDQNIEIAAGYYLKSLNFKGRFVLTDNADKKKIYSKAVEFGNKYIKLFPKSGPIRFELISSVGLLAEMNGVLKSIESGVMQQMLFHAQMLIKTDSLYMEGGGWKVLAILNYKTPAIPMVLTWPNKETAKMLLSKSLSHFPINIPNNFYYAEALLSNNEKATAKLYFELVMKLPSRKDFTIEDEYFKIKAKKYLDDMK